MNVRSVKTSSGQYVTKKDAAGLLEYLTAEKESGDAMFVTRFKDIADGQIGYGRSRIHRTRSYASDKVCPFLSNHKVL